MIPRKVLFGNPERMLPQISPDGKTLAWIAPQNGVLNVWVRALSDGFGLRLGDLPVREAELPPGISLRLGESRPPGDEDLVAARVAAARSYS